MKDPRWEPGAVWELENDLRPLAARLAVETATPGSEYVWLAGDPGGTHVVRRADMTPENGWRFVGPAEAIAEEGSER
jgi:hypothetical protein